MINNDEYIERIVKRCVDIMYRNADWYVDLFWERNFYPNLNTVINDLYKKGLIEKDDYEINIDW